MRLIDADALCEEFRMRQKAALNWKEGAILANDEEIIIRADATLVFLTEVKLTIDNAPTVERPQGEWLHPYVTDIACECSICHVQMPTYRFNFCPNCGAEMGKEANNDDS